MTHCFYECELMDKQGNKLDKIILLNINLMACIEMEGLVCLVTMTNNSSYYVQSGKLMDYFRKWHYKNGG